MQTKEDEGKHERGRDQRVKCGRERRWRKGGQDVDKKMRSKTILTVALQKEKSECVDTSDEASFPQRYAACSNQHVQMHVHCTLY